MSLSSSEPHKLSHSTATTRYGQVALYKGLSEICNFTFTENGSYIFIPYRLDELRGGASGSLVSEASLSQALKRQIGQGFAAASLECQQLFSAVICNSLFFSANGTGGQPSPLCPEECRKVEEKCPVLLKAYRETDLGRETSCDNPGRLLEPLPYCCHNGGIMDDPTVSPTQSPDLGGGSTTSSNAGAVAAGVTVTIFVLLLVGAVGACVVLVIVRKFRKLRTILHGSASTLIHMHDIAFN